MQVFFTQKFQFQNLTFLNILTINDLTLRSNVEMNVTIALLPKKHESRDMHAVSTYLH